MGCCLGGCFRLIFFWLWRAALAAAIAMLLARVDSYVEKRGLSDTMAGKAYRAYRSRTAKPTKRKEPPLT